MTDRALNLENQDPHGQHNDTDNDDTQKWQKAKNITKRKRSKSLHLGDVQKSEKTILGTSVPKTLPPAKVIKKGDEGIDLDSIPSPSLCSSQLQFNDVKSFTDFTIIADDLCIDSEIPDHIRIKYYTLCSARKTFLHAGLMQGLGSKLIAGIICEIVSISDSLKQCSLTTCRDEFSSQERVLKSFEFLGMNFGFLRTRIRKLVGLAFESQGARKYMEAKLGLVRAEDEMINVGSKLVELEATYKNHGNDVKALKFEAESYEHKFWDEIDAPW